MLGFDTFAQFPFATVAEDNSVTISVSGNVLTLQIGNLGIAANSIVEQVNADPLVLGNGTVSFVTTSNISLNPNPLVLGVGEVTVSGTAVINPTGNGIAISSGTVTIVGNAGVTLDPNNLLLGTKDVGVITWNQIEPGATMVWTPIEPY
mgnify:FL=1